MTIERIREYYWAQPFRPFTIHIAGGQRIEVPHRDFMSLGTGRTIIVYQPDDAHDVIDLLLVSHLEVAPRAAPRTQSGNGDQ